MQKGKKRDNLDGRALLNRGGQKQGKGRWGRNVLMVGQ